MDVYELIEETLIYHFHYGVLQKHFEAHRTPDGAFRNLPFLALVHTHEAEYRFKLVEPGITFTAKKGEIVFVPARIPHQLNQTAAGKHTAVHIQYSMLGALDPLSLFTVPYHFNRKQTDMVEDTLAALVAGNREPAHCLETVLERKAAAYNFLRFIIRHSVLNEEKAALLGRFTRIQPVLEYIDNNIGGQITRDYLAEIASLSPARFNYLFREIMGMPPKKYVQNQRQKRALELLRDTDLGIEEIAEQCGYCDQFYFSNRFKKELGVSPSAFRKGVRRSEWVFMGS